MRKAATALIMTAISAATYAGNPVTVKGVITDSSGEPLVGATIAVPGTTTGTTADIDGKFTLKVEDDQTIQVTSVGFQTVKLKIGKNREFNIVMKDDMQTLKDVVVVGYGTMEKKRVTSSITSIKGDNLVTGLGGSTIATALQGKVTGLTISGSSSPNSSNGYQLRGVASVNAGRGPLVVIDGVPGGDLRMINQEDVASIDVLKDASAGAIYGTRAAGGVILVTTKHAQEGKVKATYTTELSTETIRKSLDILSSRDYLEYGLGQDYGYDTDWYKQLVNENQLSQRHVLSVSGGSKALQVYTSLVYQDLKGIVIGDGRKDYSGRMNAKYKMFDGKVELTVNAQYREANRDTRMGSSSAQQAITLNPTIPVMNPNDPRQYNVNTIGVGGTTWNPVADIKLKDYKGIDKWLQADATLKINLMEGLSVQSTFGVDNRQWQEYSYYHQNHLSMITANKRGRAYHYFSKTENRNVEAYASYMHDFNNLHRVDAVMGWSFYQTGGESFDMTNGNFTVDGIGGWDMSAGTDLSDGLASMNSYKKPRERLMSFFARGNYSYDDKYMATLSFRREGSSRFGANHRWGNFWAISGGWRISKEKFMKDITWINDLKLRAGYGVTGNNDFGSGYTVRTYKSNDMWPTYGIWQPGYGSTRNINPDLKWEEKKEFDVGIDFSILHNRISGKFDYYVRKVDDMLFEVPAPQPPMVFSTIMKNAGTLTNRGWEFEITGQIIKSRNLNYSSTLRLSHNTSKIDNLGDTNSYLYGGAFPQSMGYATKLVNGSKVGQFWLFKYAGLDSNGKWLIYDKDNNVVPVSSGTASNLTDANKHYVGNAIPKLILSMDHSLSYRNFDLGLSLRSWIGYDVFSQLNLYHGLKSSSQDNLLKIAFTDNKNINDTRILTDYFLNNATFLKIDALTLGYTLDTSKWQKYLSTARVYLTVRDLARFTKYPGYNPEVNINGLEPGFEYIRSTSSMYPQTIHWTLGVQLSF
ncbi:MAG: SusC/RagA family TonB-linked outer membrane protein [Prevotellaceae bacterium]|nr:SusC/RagA family TonB-linked outer membrane protein [Prevotellaceae bacterium]